MAYPGFLGLGKGPNKSIFLLGQSWTNQKVVGQWRFSVMETSPSIRGVSETFRTDRSLIADQKLCRRLPAENFQSPIELL